MYVFIISLLSGFVSQYLGVLYLYRTSWQSLQQKTAFSIFKP